MSKRIRVIAWILTLVMLMGVIPADTVGAAEARQDTDILKMLYVEPQAKAGGSGQLIVAEAAPGNGTLTGARLFYRNGAGSQKKMQATEVAGGYAVFLVKGSGISEDSLVKLELTAGGRTYGIDLKKYRGSSDTAVSKVEATPGRAKAAMDSGDASTVQRVVADGSGQITNALAQAQQMSGTSRAGSLNPSRAGAKKIVVVLDPGHGGTESGADREWNGVAYREKEINLKISKYTKAELLTYEGVRVYLTRSTDKIMSLEERVNYGASKNATVFISQHINSTNEIEQYSVSGALVFLSKGQYRGDVTKISHEIAYTILDKLNAAGFKNQGIQYTLSTDGELYPNGALADYYGIVRRCVLAGIPGMIVEHGFVNNPNDCVEFFGSNSKIKRIGVADATAIAAYYGLKKKTDDNEKPPVSVDIGWKKEGNNTYYLDAQGNKVIGWKTVDGQQYYFNTNGAMLTGKQKISGKIHYFTATGEVMTGVQTIGSGKVTLDEQGVIIAKPAGSWYIENGQWYFKRWDGVNARGWITYKGKRCYLDKDGTMAVRWKKIKGKWYYFSVNGYMKTGVRKIGGNTCYFGEDGAALTGKQTIDGEILCLSSKGVLLPNSWRQDAKGSWYRYGDGTYPKKQWTVIDGKLYYFDKSGYMATGWIKTKKNSYYLRANGTAKNGWLKSGEKWYYFIKGRMQKNRWIRYKKNWYYVNANGRRVADKKLRIDEKRYQFDENGICLNK